MTVVQVVLGVAVFILGVLTLLLIVDNTKVLNEQKSLRAEIDDIQRQGEAIGPNPTEEEVAAFYARVKDFERRFAEFRRSPFVIQRPM